MVFRNPSHTVFSHQIKDPECFADSNQNPWNPPTIHCPDLIATVLQTYLLSLCALLSKQSHLFLICVALTSNDSRIILHKICQILKNCQGKWLLASSSAPGTSFDSSGFLFYTGRIVTTELPNLVPQQCIDDCDVIQSLHWEFCDPQLLNHLFFPLWVRLYQHVSSKKPWLFSSSNRYHNLGLSGNECRHYACPRLVPLLLATPWVILERNWKCLDVQSTGLIVALKEYFHQPTSLWTPVASPASHAIDHSVLLRLLQSLCFGFYWFWQRVSPWLRTHTPTSFCCGIFKPVTESFDEDVEEGCADDVEELVDKPGTTDGAEFDVLQSILLPFLMRCGFWPLVQW